jgi:hypothetical protein
MESFPLVLIEQTAPIKWKYLEDVVDVFEEGDPLKVEVFEHIGFRTSKDNGRTKRTIR